jgi:hypothetical protein
MGGRNRVVRRLLAFSLLAGPLLAAPADDYGLLLAKSVRDDGIDYAELAAGRAALDAYVRSLADADPGATDPQRIAFWINAHNALVLQQVLDTGRRSPKDVDGFLDKRTWRVAGRDVTLGRIGGEILAGFSRPVAVFGLCNGSRSSPPLSAVLYRAEDLDAALAQQARAYLADEEQNVFDYAQLRAELSMLFLWHRDEFGEGAAFQARVADLLPAEKPFDAVARSLRTTPWRVSFKPWDWSLGEAGAAKRGVHPAWIAVYAVAALGLLFLGFRALLARRP